MSTRPRHPQPEQTSRTRETTRSGALAQAQRTFEPTNTNPTPAMFADRWAVDD